MSKRYSTQFFILSRIAFRLCRSHVGIVVNEAVSCRCLCTGRRRFVDAGDDIRSKKCKRYLTQFFILSRIAFRLCRSDVGIVVNEAVSCRCLCTGRRRSVEAEDNIRSEKFKRYSIQKEKLSWLASKVFRKSTKSKATIIKVMKPNIESLLWLHYLYYCWEKNVRNWKTAMTESFCDQF